MNAARTARADGLSIRHQRELLEFLTTLPAAQTETLVLRAFQRLSVDEVAECMRVPPRTVEMRLQRVRKRLERQGEHARAIADFVARACE
jgi:RNA polymerase sigma factor (sigma-70 family)